MKSSQKFQLLKDLFLAKMRPVSSGKRRGNLVIRLDRIGDFALFAPYAKALFSQSEKNYLLVNELWAPLCAKMFPEAELLPLGPGKFLNDPRYRSQMLETVRSLKVKRVYQPRFYRELFVEELLAMAAAPEETVRFETTPFHLQPKLLKLFSSSQAAEVSCLPGEHELQRNARFARQCNIRYKAENPWLKGLFSPPEKLPSQDYVCVFPGSGKGKKCCWQSEKWGKLLNILDAPFYLITGTPAEREQMECIARMLPAEKRAVAADLSLDEFAGVVSHARCALGNDTGGIHLAAMSGVPALAISGRGQPGWFLPYPEQKHLPPGVVPPVAVSTPCSCENCFWRCSYMDNGICRCVAEISVDQVLDFIEKSNFSALR